MIDVLVADDHPFLRAGLEAVLRTAGMVVVASVGDGDAALAAIPETDPDVVVLDVAMPARDGVATLAAMREGGDERPVVILTASIDDEKLLAAIRHGASGIVLKEDAEDFLIDCIRNASAGQRTIDPRLASRITDLASGEKPQRRIDKLGRREKEIVERVARGLRNRQIGEELSMSEGSVKVYLHTIFEKLEVRSRTELAILYHEETS
ncbi:response regulator transcription factor [Erythrobacter sp. CCH5-A1]|jgi:two-component system nitrate/nitrite response regulator NarP|uniref:response regulator n=1 Tax=Erythrobacter sp. CCH5-A1 TaxID=1768792 RepID=UPI000834ACBA|nr:response regulator transcription factor [Erythrobacter sp. CCH5-A1]